jgi:hypothetical protein
MHVAQELRVLTGMSRFTYACEHDRKRPRPESLATSSDPADARLADGSKSQRKVYAHPCHVHLDEMVAWLRETECGPNLREKFAFDGPRMMQASWRRIVGQAAAVESLSNGERRKIWKMLRDSNRHITPRHLFVNFGLTGGQICLFYEVQRSNYNYKIADCARLAHHALRAHPEWSPDPRDHLL